MYIIEDWFDRCIDGGRKRPDLSENIGTRFCEDDDESKSGQLFEFIWCVIKILRIPSKCA